MRYFLDTEYDGWGGALISLALVAESDEELYLVLDHQPSDPWVQRHVMPFLDSVPEPLRSPRLSRAAAAEALAFFLGGDPDVVIVADWPEDIAQFSMLLVTGPGTMVALPTLRFQLIAMTGFSSIAPCCIKNTVSTPSATHNTNAASAHANTRGECQSMTG